MMEDYPFEDFDPDGGWALLCYQNAPKVEATGLPAMAYAWRVWLEYKDQAEPVPDEIQQRVDDFCRKEAIKAVQLIPRMDSSHADCVFSDYFIDAKGEALVKIVDEYTNALGSIVKACQRLAREWDKDDKKNLMPSGGSAGAGSIRTEYYLAKKRLADRRLKCKH